MAASGRRGLMNAAQALLLLHEMEQASLSEDDYQSSDCQESNATTYTNEQEMERDGVTHADTLQQGCRPLLDGDKDDNQSSDCKENNATNSHQVNEPESVTNADKNLDTIRDEGCIMMELLNTRNDLVQSTAHVPQTDVLVHEGGCSATESILSLDLSAILDAESLMQDNILFPLEEVDKNFQNHDADNNDEAPSPNCIEQEAVVPVPYDMSSQSEHSFIAVGTVEIPVASPEEILVEPPLEASTPRTMVEQDDITPMPSEEPRSPSKYRRAKPDTWKCNVNKRRRLEGKEYDKQNKNVKEERTLGPSCNSEFCKKSQKRACTEFNDNDRENIFKKFWSLQSWESKKTFVQSLVSVGDIKQKSSLSSRRNNSLFYHLKNVNGKTLPVCKSMFCLTLGISQRTIGSWLAKEDQTPDAPLTESVASNHPKAPKSGKTKPLNEEETTFLKRWLFELPTVESHYCRKSDVYKNKLFLFPGTKVSDVYSDYTQAADKQGMRAGGLTFFRKMFQSLGFSVFVPKKDQCEKCIQKNLNNIDEEEYNKHICDKNKARDEKDSDKAKCESETSVWTLDLQSVLLCPQSNASSMYYKTKIQLHNMTYFNLQTKEGYCYVYDETDGDVSSDMFAYLHCHHFEEYLKSHPAINKIILWSDNCSYQNKCVTVSNMLLHLAKTNGITIEQKFLTKGHTQMECDSMHSTIERNIVCDVFTPSDYIVLMQTARKRPQPYFVEQLSFELPFKLSASYLSSIRPGRMKGDDTVSDLKALQYTGSGIKYKIDHQAEWEILPQRLKDMECVDRVRLFQERRKVTARKYADVMSMIMVMPEHAKQYFTNLPHE